LYKGPHFLENEGIFMVVTAFETETYLDERQFVTSSEVNFTKLESQIFEQPEVLTELEESRLLTEVDHLVESLNSYGNIPEVIKRDVTTNLKTSLAEVSMPYAVTRTAHKVETIWNPEEQRSQRIFKWLGRSAVGVAESGYDFHFSDAAKQRVDIEVAEAQHTQETLRAGRVQFFISPRMSEQDAPESVAKKEHLHDEDSIRASFLIKDYQGNETHRVMESLLVRDVPLEAWVALLRDPNNIFGKTVEIEDEKSALSVMGTFEELELNEEKAPEGPVSLIEAVVPYIKDDMLQLSVMLQLHNFRKEQYLYQKQSEFFANEWYTFELELAHSLRAKVATPTITQFVTNIKESLPEGIRDSFNAHQIPGGFKATRQFIALAEKVKRNILATKAGISVKNENIIEQVDSSLIEIMQSNNENKLPNHLQAKIDQQLDRSIIEQNVETGGGCTGACGIESVKEGEAESYISRLGGEKGDKVAKDMVRSCKCGAKSIVYVYNSKKVIKYCESCEEKEVQFTSRKAE
jgi:hypothetical protein